jgi:hypothetical protein
MRKLTILAGTLALAACSGGGGGGDSLDGGGKVIATCDAILGGAVDDTACPGCTIESAQLVADDDGYSFAIVDVPQSAPGAGATLRVTAPEGTVFPAGSDAGVFLSPPVGGSSVSVEVSNATDLRTYLEGVPQDVNPASNSIRWLPSSDEGVPRMYISTHTTRPFDAVEVVINNSGAAVDEPTDWHLHEICSHGWVAD